MIFEILAVAHLLGNMPVTPWGDGLQKVRCTCYLPTGNKTADGTVPYEGICASNRDHLGDVAVLYSIDGEFIGLFECRDVGGHRNLRNGTAVDIYRDSLDRAFEWVGEHGDYVYIYWIEGGVG
jgi:hypothetical protein